VRLRVSRKLCIRIHSDERQTSSHYINLLQHYVNRMFQLFRYSLHEVRFRRLAFNYRHIKNSDHLDLVGALARGSFLAMGHSWVRMPRVWHSSLQRDYCSEVLWVRLVY
jgi:hypothetical protein